MSAFAFTKKRCGALELNKQPGQRMELVTTTVPLPVLCIMLNQRILFLNQLVIEGTANPVWGFGEAGCLLSLVFICSARA